MRTLTLLLLIPALAVTRTAAQEGGPPVHACEAELAWLADFTATNYAGFESKASGETGAAYSRHLGGLLTDARAAANQAQCDAVLRLWTDFFQDGHLSFARRRSTPTGPPASAETDDEIRARFAAWPTRSLTEHEARAALDVAGDTRSPVEGIWESEDGAYRVALLADDAGTGRYLMSVIRADSVWWVPGQIKAIFAPADAGAYHVRFFMRDHSEEAWTGRVNRNVLILNERSIWFRHYPGSPDDVSRDTFLRSRNTRFAATTAGDGTAMVHIPSFDDAARMDSLFDTAGDLIRGAERLLIDLRGNGGGSDYNFRMLLPLIYTDTIRMVSNAVLATPANIAANEALVADTTIPAGIRELLAGQVEAMKAVEGGWHPFPDRIHLEPSVLDRPSAVAVLVDSRCASSCEQFLLAARQSRKVTIYGWPTAGILDFGNVRRAEMPGGSLVLFYPTTRSKRLPAAPVDGVGILPDVPIPAEEPDPIAWVLARMAGPAVGR
jgi:hypothetical protein